MTGRRIVSIAILLILAIALFFAWHRLQGNTRPEGARQATQTNRVASPESVIVAVKSALTHRQMMAARREAESQPIAFYGKIVDQDGQAVPGVEVQYMIYPTPQPPDPGIGRTVSGANGEFYVGGHTGASISFGLKKDGYLLADTNAGATFSLLSPPTERYIPDSANPRVLRLWRSRGAPQLVEINQRYQCALPSCSIRIDVIDGKAVSDGGDLYVEFEKGPGSQDLGQKFDWYCIVRAIDGGIRIATGIEEMDTTFEAPAEGYAKELEIVMKKDSIKWRVGAAHHVYLKSRNGQVFAKFELSVSVNAESKASVWLRRGVANANGSRNLEPSH